MDRQELEQKYDNFINSSHYKQAGLSPKFMKKNPDLSSLSVIADNMVCNILFLSNYFELARSNDELTQAVSNYMILVENTEVTLNVNDAPNFLDKENYLNWLDLQINTNSK
ncbi:hypothetical protein [Acinetobacter sp. ESBL14]|uniref:hypothetical protein n=1 Tax=Acinetobacter sp. ESBL14 TaxID=3077329 RepID=UPI002FCC592F